MARYILNSAVITAPGVYRYVHVTKEEAQEWAKQGEYISTVGYEQTAVALSELLGIDVPVNRMTIRMEPGDEALVFRLVFPPGTPRIDPKDKGALSEHLLKGNYEIGILERLS